MIKFTIYRYEKVSEKVCQFFIKLERGKKKISLKKKEDEGYISMDSLSIVCSCKYLQNPLPTQRFCTSCGRKFVHYPLRDEGYDEIDISDMIINPIIFDIDELEMYILS